MKAVGLRRVATILLCGTLVCCWSPLAWSGEKSQQLYAAGLVPFHKGRYEEALALFQQAATADSQDYLAVYYVGLTYGKLGRYTESLPHLEKTVGLRPNFAPARQDLGVAYYQVQRYPEALAQLRVAERLTPTNGLVHYYSGLSAYRVKEHAAAQASLQRAAELDPALRYRAQYYLGLSWLAAGRRDKAVQAFQVAASESPRTEVAGYAQQRIEEITEGRHQGRPEKRWNVRLGLSSQFDSNVLLQPDDEGVLLGRAGDGDDFRFTFFAGGQVDLWQGASTYLRSQYDFYQTVQVELSEFDFQTHLFRLTGGWSPTSFLTVGLEGGTHYFRLGGDSYLHEYYGMPFVGLSPLSWAYTYLSYRLLDQNYLTTVFDPIRSGLFQTAMARQYFLLHGFERYLFVGYQYTEEDPRLRAGNDFQRQGNAGEVGGRTPSPFGTALEALYSFRRDEYTFFNSRTAFTQAREDDRHSIYFILRKPLTPRVEVNVSYLGAVNNSNIADFEYDRHIGSVGFEVGF